MHRLSNRLLFPFFALAALGAAFSVWTVEQAHEKAMAETQVLQGERADRIVSKLNAHVQASEQLSSTLKVMLESTRQKTKKQIEELIDQVLISGSEATVYGVGVWFQPFGFNKSTRFFGPYVHRSQARDKTILTYEWTTPAYNFPEQPWYQSGMKAKGSPSFTDPYLDAGTTYMTLSRAFYDKSGVIAGVITVDMILPQLQNILEEAGSVPGHRITVLSKEAKVLARNLAQVPEKFGDDVSKESTPPVRALVEKLGWQIQVTADETITLSEYHKTRLRTWIGFSVFLLSLSLVTLSLHVLAERLRLAQMKSLNSSKLASLGEMSAGIAHEINNPLAIISGSVDILSKISHDPEKFTERVESIQRATRRITKIVNGLRKFSRNSSENNYSEHSLSTIVRESMVLTEAKAKRQNTLVTLELKTESPILCDEVAIEQVVINLISNAIDAIEGRDEKWVMVEVSEDSESILLRVTDSGLGIPDETQRRLFEPFFTTKPVGKGTGLGLSITKGILDEHQATICLAPNMPNTCFEIRFNRIAIARAA